MRCPVVPFGLERDDHESVGRQRESLLRHRRARHVAAEALDSCAAVRRDHDVRVDVEATRIGPLPDRRRLVLVVRTAC